MNCIKKYWWIVVIIVLIAYIITIGVINCKLINDATRMILDNLSLLITPLSIILGLVLGYPLLKRKLVDSYITKQFEIIHDNNREVKKECLRLQEKYPIKPIGNTLTKEYLEEAVQDIFKLKELATEANQDAYKYSYLVYKSLKLFAEKPPATIADTYLSQYYCENISNFINGHLDQIYKYSQSIGYISATVVKRKTILVDKLKRYVTDNHLYQVDNIDQSLSYKHTSALLVLFSSINVAVLSSNNGLLFQCCYEVAPSPSPFVRMMFNRGIYIPPILYGGKAMGFFDKRLYLIGFKREHSTKLHTGITTYSYIFYYANISMGGFVDGLMKEKESLKEFWDEYIEEHTLNVNDITEYDVEREMIRIKVGEGKLFEYFKKVQRQIKNKMETEMIK